MCEDAIELSVPYGCQMQTASNAYCTEEEGVAPDPDCLGFKGGGDIWYKFVMPSSVWSPLKSLAQAQIQQDSFPCTPVLVATWYTWIARSFRKY